MYNGIGLSSVRGSATSGHVQSNQTYIKRSRLRNAVQAASTGGGKRRDFDASAGGGKVKSDMEKLQAVLSDQAGDQSGMGGARGSQEIVKHSKLRSIENSLLEYRDKLEGLGMAERDIEENVESERCRLRQAMGLGDAGQSKSSKTGKSGDSQGQGQSFVPAQAVTEEDAEVDFEEDDDVKKKKEEHAKQRKIEEELEGEIRCDFCTGGALFVLCFIYVWSCCQAVILHAMHYYCCCCCCCCCYSALVLAACVIQL